MKAYRLHGEKDFRLEEVETVQQDNQVGIDIHSVGICGSDIHYYNHGRCGIFAPKEPFSLGHEFSGVISSVPENTSEFKVGMRVTVDPLQNCGECDFCKQGHRNLCNNKKYMGSAAAFPHVQGAFRDTVSVPLENVHILPDSVSFEEGAMIEPAAVSLHAVKQAGDISGKKVLVSGGGTIGQFIMRIAIAMGADVTLSDPKPFARDMALRGGASNAINPIDHEFEANSFDVVYEASGAAPSLVTAIKVACKRGVVVQVGTLPDSVELPANLIMAKELKLVGAIQFSSEFAEVLAMVADGKLCIAELNTHRFEFADAVDALKCATIGDGTLKVQVAL